MAIARLQDRPGLASFAQRPEIDRVIMHIDEPVGMILGEARVDPVRRLVERRGLLEFPLVAEVRGEVVERDCRVGGIGPAGTDAAAGEGFLVHRLRLGMFSLTVQGVGHLPEAQDRPGVVPPQDLGEDLERFLEER